MWGNNEGSSWNPNASYPPPVAGNVDWAALAQQWIAMKGQGSFDLPPVAVPPPPSLHHHLPSTSFPPPNICAPPPIGGQQHSHLGEANMDLDEEDEEEEENEEEILKAAPEPSPKSMTNRHRKQSSADESSTLIPQKIMNQKSSHSPTIDANARKKLPPWIREGLEKMEKEKQKKEQMEKRQREREEVMRRIREEEKVQDMKYTKKGRARMDEENHPEVETEEDEERRGLDDPDSPSNGYVNKTPSKSKEELLEEMTITLRRTLTEILLEVTSSEIQNVCVEILDKYRRRQSGIAVKGSHQKALGQLLSGYASDEDRQSSDGSSVENESRFGSSSYSDEENLESIIRRKKREFEKTSEKINSICAAKEENFSLREKRWIDEGELNKEEGVNLAHIYGKGTLPNLSKDIDNSEETSTTSPVRSGGSKAQTRRNRSKERKSRENNRRSVSSDRDSREKRSRSKERSSHRSRERYSHDRRSASRERRLSYDKTSSSRCSIDRRSVSRERSTSHNESSTRKHKSKSSKHTRESRERSRDIKTHRRHSRDDKRKRRKRSRHSSSSSSSPSPIRSSSSKKSRRRKRSRS